jgi:Holliday junction resolvase RusA-like endonuclease
LTRGCSTVLFEIPFMPPTSNHCYVTIWQKKMRVLSKEANAFKKRVLTEIVPTYLNEITLLDRYAIYDVHYRFFFERDDVMTKTYGEKNGAESQYKKMDLENRLKLLSDVVSSSIGIDDSQFFAGHQEKLSCSLVGGTPQVHIFIRKRTLVEFGF